MSKNPAPEAVPAAGPTAVLSELLRSPRFLYHALIDDAGSPPRLGAVERAARLALVVAGSAVVESAIEAADEEAGGRPPASGSTRARCAPPRAREVIER